jgi:hypothetical protein
MASRRGWSPLAALASLGRAHLGLALAHRGLDTATNRRRVPVPRPRQAARLGVQHPRAVFARTARPLLKAPLIRVCRALAGPAALPPLSP